jgi:hypothetical protein
MEDNIVFRCSECGEVRSNLGALHSHIDRHLEFSISFGPETEKYRDMTQVLKIKEVEKIDLEEVDGYPSRNGVVDFFTGILRLKT